jgi:membrane protease YdiL (CAAX protease family)
MREPWEPPDPGRWERGSGTFATRAGTGYAVLAAMATALAVALRDGVPWVYPEPWLRLDGATSLALSALLGLLLALVAIASTRLTVPRFEWARRLHGELRPIAVDLSLAQILVLAGLSSLGEELLFRGLFMPWLGLWITSLLFGLLHQVRGPARWVWAGWATAMGLALGSIFALTGSLVGPLLAHAIVNAVNLAYLRDHPSDPGGCARPHPY